MTTNRPHDETDLPAAEPAAQAPPAAERPDGSAVARARAEAHGLFLFGRTPEEDEIREMYGWGV